MTTTINNRKILDLKSWEMLSPAPVAAAAALFVASSRCYRQQQLYFTTVNNVYLYSALEDGWTLLPSAGMGGTLAAGACGQGHAWSTGASVGVASLTATAGTTSTITTNQTLARDLRGYSIHILSGPNAGVTLPILSNTIGANAVITVATQGVAFSASTVYRLGSPRWYCLMAGALAANQFKVYDFATNTWTALVTTNLVATVATDSRLLTTPSWMGSGYLQFATGTATSATGTTLVNSGKTWTASQWINSQIRIVSGTGAGQIRTITANDATSVTVAAWTVQPDATSVYSIEGNDDYIYYMGSGAVGLYRYSISANTWSLLSPGTARAAAPSTGMSGHWVYGSDDTAWKNESAIINGRYIYSLRGGASAAIDRYDIAANAWTAAAITYAPATETFTTGTKYAYNGNFLYITKEATGRFFRYNFVTSEMDGWGQMTYTQGAAVLGDTMFDVSYVDGATTVVYIYWILNTSTIVLRQMVV